MTLRVTEIWSPWATRIILSSSIAFCRVLSLSTAVANIGASSARSSSITTSCRSRWRSAIVTLKRENNQLMKLHSQTLVHHRKSPKAQIRSIQKLVEPFAQEAKIASSNCSEEIRRGASQSLKVSRESIVSLQQVKTAWSTSGILSRATMEKISPRLKSQTNSAHPATSSLKSTRRRYKWCAQYTRFT